MGKKLSRELQSLIRSLSLAPANAESGRVFHTLCGFFARNVVAGIFFGRPVRIRALSRVKMEPIKRKW